MNKNNTELFNPFPGLRPFEADEDHLFFGRERETDELLRRLRTNRFVSVLGTSGSGKSSLVRSGLIPSLYSGFMVDAGSTWRVAVFRPGDDPIGNLAGSLDDPHVLGFDPELADSNRMLLETTLRRSALGLADCVKHASLPEHENLLVVVDQFEELFRFRAGGRDSASRDEAIAFAKLLLGAADQTEVPVYVVITMRSDFIGDCMEYPGLPEAINEGQYLIPRMTRSEMRQAIESPVAVGGGKIAPRLVARLLNEVGDDPDQLPVLQHALMRTWDHWTEQDQEEIDIDHYELIGTMEEALSRHAEEAYQELGDEYRKEIAERLFKALTDKRLDGRGVRRPTSVQDVAKIADVDARAVIDVVDVFRKSGRSFLMPPPAVGLQSETIIDISHESLMRNWGRLSEWVEEESQAGKAYRRLSRSAQRYESGEGSLWVDPELALGMLWKQQNKPTEVWAERYGGDLSQALSFITSSSEAQDAARKAKEEEEKAKLRRARTLAAVLGTAAVITLIFGVLAIRSGVKAKRAEQLAKKEAETARAVTDFLVGLFEVADPEAGAGGDITAREILDQGAGRIDTELMDQPQVQSRMKSTVGKVYGSLGLYDEARPLLDASVETADRILGPDHPQTLEAKFRLAEIYEHQGQFRQADSLHTAILESRRALLGEKDPQTLESIAGLAKSRHSMGLYAESEALAREASRGQTEIYGPDHPKTLKSGYLIGLALFDLGKYPEAERVLTAIWDAQKRAVGAEHADAIQTMAELADLHAALGRYDQAQEMFEQNLASQIALYGERHPKTLAARHRLAELQLDRGSWNECEAGLRRVIEARREVLGPDHPMTLDAETTLAWLLHLQQRLEEAETLASRSFNVSVRDLGRKSMDAMRHANVLASVYLEQQRFPKAESLHVVNLEIRKRVVGEAHEATITTRNNMAVMYSRWGRLNDMYTLFGKNLELCREFYGSDHPTTLFMMNNMISGHQTMRNLEEAEKLSIESVERHNRLFGPDNPQTLQANLQYINTLTRQKKFAEAEALCLEWVEGHKRLFGEPHPETKSAKSRLGWLYQGTNQIEKAVSMREEVVEDTRSLYGELHSETVQAYGQMSWMYMVAGEPEKSLEYRRKSFANQKQIADRPGAGVHEIFDYADMLNNARPELQDREAAIDYATRANEMTDFGSRKYLVGLSEAYFYNDEFVPAIKYAEMALALAPDDVPEIQLEMEDWLARVHKSSGNLEPTRRLRMKEIAQLKKEADSPAAAPANLRQYAWVLMSADPMDLRNPQEALKYIQAANESTGFSDPSLLDELALAHHLSGNREQAVKIQLDLLDKIPADDAWGRPLQETLLDVYKGDFVDKPLAELTGMWTGKIGPMNGLVEAVYEGGYLVIYNRQVLPWIPKDEVFMRINAKTKEAEMQVGDDGWTNVRYEPAGFGIKSNGQAVVWNKMEWRGATWSPSPNP